MRKPGPQMVDRHGVDFKVTAGKMHERDSVSALQGWGLSSRRPARRIPEAIGARPPLLPIHNPPPWTTCAP